ncbi:MAG: hypothetical protein HYU26_06780 [Candidatus Rokubacteria bacterium]|nr:hypothetical protein [Candidatus Rokubacteria bacterium]
MRAVLAAALACAAVLALAAVLGFSVRPAAAEDFTLRVPVNLSNVMPGEAIGWVNCWVGTDALYSDNQPNVGSDGRIGRGGAQFAIPAGGGFNGTVEVKFNAFSGQNPSLAMKYKCWFYLGDMGDPGNVPRVNHSNPTKRPKAGTSFANVVVGPLP